MTDHDSTVNEPSALWRAYTKLVQQGGLHGEAIAESLGLDATALRCIGFAWTEPDLTPGRLAELTGLTTGAVTGVLDRLERAGFIQRQPDPHDRRRTIVHVSHDRGRDVGLAYEPMERATEAVFARLDDAQRSLLARVLQSLATVVDDDTARLRAANRGGMVGEMFTAPLGQADAGRLVFLSGAPRIAFRAAPLGLGAEARMVAELFHTSLAIGGGAADGQLCRATFSGPVPLVGVHKGDVRIGYKRRLGLGNRETRVELSQAVPWTIDVSGGLSTFVADLRRVRVHGLRIAGGVDDVTARLGSPDGTSRLRLSGGARDVTIEHPVGTAIRVSVSGGVHDITVGREHLREVHGTVRLATSGADRVADRFEVEVTGGARTIRVTTA